MTTSDSTAHRARVVALAPGLQELPEPLVVGCSGGADSLALVALLSYRNIPALVVYVDHGLRSESADDADIVRAAASDCEMPVRVVTVDVARGANLEARARDARYLALRTCAADVGASGIAVAHTGDDQAETVVLNLLRGAALAGLSGIAPVRNDIYRPLLGVRRADTEAVCAEMGWQPVVDPTNADPVFLRNRIRHEVLPLLSEAARR
ncbi:MAG: tRNA lysidine(34) synthetase TilS, partial [Acidimicrobiia bacterium]